MIIVIIIIIIIKNSNNNILFLTKTKKISRLLSQSHFGRDWVWTFDF